MARPSFAELFDVAVRLGGVPESQHGRSNNIDNNGGVEQVDRLADKTRYDAAFWSSLDGLKLLGVRRSVPFF